jgi:hypothetical protein
MNSMMKRSIGTVAAAGALALGSAAAPAFAATNQTGLVNVSLTDTTVQVPVGVAAVVCGVQANVIAANNFLGNTTCTSTSRSTATGGGGGGGGATNQSGLVNVALTNTTVQIPIGVAAAVCGVQVNALAAGNVAGSTACSAVSEVTATA